VLYRNRTCVIWIDWSVNRSNAASSPPTTPPLWNEAHESTSCKMLWCWGLGLDILWLWHWSRWSSVSLHSSTKKLQRLTFCSVFNNQHTGAVLAENFWGVGPERESRRRRRRVGEVRGGGQFVPRNGEIYCIFTDC